MKRATIRNKTPKNFNIVVKYLMDEKHYSAAQAEKIAHLRFETLSENPGGNIWGWLENTIPAEEHEMREIARRYAKAAGRDKYILRKVLDNTALNPETREKAEKLYKFYDRGMVTIEELFLMNIGYFEQETGKNETC